MTVPDTTPDGSEPDLDLCTAPIGGSELRAIARLWKLHARDVVARFTGVSMLPTIIPDSELRVHCTEEVAVDDIVAWVHHERLIVHRVVGKGPGWLLTCGDAGWLPDPPVMQAADLVGRIVARRDGAIWMALPPAPRSYCRALVVGSCLRALRSDPRLGRLVILGLLSARRWLYFAPRAAAARVLRHLRRRPASR